MAALILFFYLFSIFTTSLGGSSISYEYGYTVSTVLEGDKVEASLNPFAALPLPGGEELLLLDSANSRFYTLSLPLSQESKINPFAGSGSNGEFSDGDAASAKFNHPRSFAVDSRGNVYVADQFNHAIRKISSMGVTTIAGGFSKMAGHNDGGPGQNATFSNDFYLTYIPHKCALLIFDHGTRRIRQMNLKAVDCLSKTPQLELGLTWTFIIGTFCLLVGLAAGFAVRPWIISRTESSRSLPTQQDMEALPNSSGETSTDLLLRHQKRSC